MSRDGSVELVWGGDSRKFRLGIDELFALQEKLNAGPQEITSRLRFGTWRVQDIHEVLRVSLIGAGMEAKAAAELVQRCAGSGRLVGAALVAQAVMITAISGDEDDPVGKEQAEAPAPGATSSEPPPSTAQESSSD